MTFDWAAVFVAVLLLIRNTSALPASVSYIFVSTFTTIDNGPFSCFNDNIIISVADLPEGGREGAP